MEGHNLADVDGLEWVALSFLCLAAPLGDVKAQELVIIRNLTIAGFSEIP